MLFRSQLNRGARLVEILKQPQYQPLPVERQVALIYAGTKGYLDNVAIADVRVYESELYKFIETRHPEVFRGIVEKKQLDDELKASRIHFQPGVNEDLAATATVEYAPRAIRRILPLLRDSRPLFTLAARWWGPWVFQGTREIGRAHV